MKDNSNKPECAYNNQSHYIPKYGGYNSKNGQWSKQNRESYQPVGGTHSLVVKQGLLVQVNRLSAV